MEFREGMLGVVVVALALTGGMFASYFAGIEGEDREYTDYQYLADVSGLFDYDKSPTFIEFDPSSNYTGYYSEDTGEYWPTDYVDYVQNIDPTTKKPRVNNYRINLEPIVNETEYDKDISDVTEKDIPGTSNKLAWITYWTENWNNQGNGQYNIVTKTTTLSQLVSQFDYDEYDRIRIASDEGLDVVVSGGTTSDPTEVGWTIFYPKSWLSDSGGNAYRYTLNVAQKEVYDTFTWPSYVSDGVKIAKLSLSCDIDLRNNLVTLYYDNEFKNRIGTFSLDDMCMAYSQGSSPMISPRVVLSDTATIVIQQFPPAEYLDPNYGVGMKEA